MIGGSLCAGVGGIDLGLIRAGFRMLWQVEYDEWRYNQLEINFPETTKFRRLQDVGSHNLSPVDIICAGWPCQPFSVAGKRRGKTDDRYLWPEVHRVVAELSPSWFLGENVPGIIRISLDETLTDLENLGYTCWTFIIPAVAFDAEHRRDRLFIIAYSDKARGLQQEGLLKQEWRRLSNSIETAASNSLQTRLSGRVQARAHIEDERNVVSECRSPINSAPLVSREHWNYKPVLGGRLHGIPDRVDRIQALGEAVVPQVAEFIGRQIMRFEAENAGNQ